MTRTLPFLLAAVLLAGCATSQQAQQAELERQRREQELADLRADRDALQAELATARDSLQFLDDIDSGRYYDRVRSLTNRIDRLEYEVALLQDGGVPVATIPADDLFDPGTATLSARGKTELQSLAEALETKHRRAAIRVEGHTDNVPLGPSLREKYPTNWELSAARASAVVRHLIDEHEMDAARFSLAGYGDTRPIASTQTAEGRRQNRRIQVLALIPVGDPPEPARTAQGTARRDNGR